MVIEKTDTYFKCVLKIAILKEKFYHVLYSEIKIIKRLICY